MKKLFILLWTLILLGCSKGETLKIETVAFLHYEDLILAQEQLLDVRGLINNITFSNKLIDDNYKNYIYVITNDEILEIFVSSNNNMLLINNGTRYYSNDVKQITALMTYLQNMQEMYTDNTFYTIESIYDYLPNRNDTYINIHKNDYYIVMKSQINVFNFKINRIEINNGEINVLEELYTNDYIPKDKRIVIRINKPINMSNYNITFDTPYGYNISIMPYYNSNTERIEFTKTFKKIEAI